MKLSHLLIAIVLVIVGWFAWRQLPGVRARVGNTVEEYGGWTREARETDPVGFLTFAEERFRSDLEEFASSREQLAAAGERAQQQVVLQTKLIDGATELAELYRTQFRAAESSGVWPVQFQGASYSREQFLEQVETILTEKNVATKVLATYREVISTAEERDAELRERIATTKATLQQLAAQKELVRVDKLTAEADELLAKVDELLGGNKAATSSENGPVRSLEDLLSGASQPTKKPSSATDALEFLKAD